MEKYTLTGQRFKSRGSRPLKNMPLPLVLRDLLLDEKELKFGWAKHFVSLTVSFWTWSGFRSVVCRTQVGDGKIKLDRGLSEKRENHRFQDCLDWSILCLSVATAKEGKNIMTAAALLASKPKSK